MQHKRSCPTQCLDSMPVLEIFFGIGRHRFLEIRGIQPGPLSLFFVPPHQFLAFAPWLPIWTRRSPVIKDAAVLGPRESPAVAKITFWFPLVGLVLAGTGKHPGIDPAAASGRAVVFQRLETGQQLSIGSSASIDFLE